MPTPVLHLSKPEPRLRADLLLDGSKSISNRALLILALAGADPDAWLSHASTSSDTQQLRRLLAQTNTAVYNAGDAGTAFRFLTAYLALQPGEQVLTGSARMQERPIGPLVDALRALGTDIQFLEKEGYPPLRIGEMKGSPTPSSVRVAADVSSQFLSALAMIGPYLPGGLAIEPEGQLVSRPYLDMTLQIMRYFGAEVDWEGETLLVQPGAYRPRPLVVEADWSAAAYWYAMAALSAEADVTLHGLGEHSWQGDAAVAEMMQGLGVKTFFGKTEGENGRPYVRLTKSEQSPKPLLEQDFLGCPDLVQPLAVVCAGLGVQGLFSGLETLAIKETDRVAALKKELEKVGVTFSRLPARFSRKHPERQYYLLEGSASLSPDAPLFATYGDHRMAMSLATLATLGAVAIENPDVVTKSYPQFWTHLAAAGFVASLRPF